MANKVNGIILQLSEDCAALMCVLDNAALECFMIGDNDIAEELEQARDRLEIAMYRHDTDTMQAILDEYHGMFKRYR